MSRSEAYRQLAAQMKMKHKDCHIKLMDERTARRVPIAVWHIMNDDGQVLE
jgi:hypothetical protein